MKWINAGDIKTWSLSNQRDCASLLPELLRRLILATSISVEEINFPSGDSISIGGWDGRLIAKSISPFFPTGQSGWELGVKSSPGKKAEEDYIKRTQDSLGIPAKNSTFVFVTTRSWPNREKWVKAKRATKEWRGVSVIGADDIEQWLELSPAVSLWLANHLHKSIGNMRGIETFWEEWSTVTKPSMTIELVIAGREDCVNHIHKWLLEPPNVLSVQGDSPDEPFAFLYSSLCRLPNIQKVKAFSRCVVVDNSDEMRLLLQTFSNPLIIVAPGECSGLVGLAIRKGHHVFLASGENLLSVGSVDLLTRPKLDKIKKYLKDQGLSEIEANRTSRDSGRSIPVLRRRMSISQVVATPPWGAISSIQILMPILFIGAWQEKKEGDRLIVEKISGKPYKTYLTELQSMLSIDDSPVRRIGDVWMLKSPMDSWFVLAKNLNDDLLIRYGDILKDVFLKADPKYELPPDKRWAAAIYGKSNSFSEWLRDGLTESLALISVYGNQASNTSSISVFTSQIVKNLLSFSKDWKIWASLDSSIPRLAEANPDAFLKVVNDALRIDSSLFISLLKDDGDSIFGNCNHSGLLWALESLAWDPTYFSRSVGILFKLAEIDPGGRYANRPINTLTDIFMPKWPQTYATKNDRIIILDKCIALNPQLVWKFTKGYFSRGSFTESYRFRWRDYGSTRSGFDSEDNPADYIKELIPRIQKLACKQINIFDALNEFIQLPNEVQSALINHLIKIDKNKFSNIEKKLISNCLREAMSRINTYEKALLQKDIPTLNKLLKKFMPADLLDQVGWLLDSPWPSLPNGDKKDHILYEKQIKLERHKAARKVLDKIPIKQIVVFASNTQYPGVLAKAIGDVAKNGKEDNKIIDGFLEQSKNNPLLISAYAQTRTEIAGNDWIKNQVKRLKKNKTYTSEVHALLFKGLPDEKDTWLLVETAGKEVELKYWKRSRCYSHSDKNEDAEMAVKKLLMAKCPKVALEVAGNHKLSLPSKLLKQIILDLLSEPKKLVAEQMTDYYLANVFAQMYDRKELSDEEISKLEWPFAVLFEDIQLHTNKPLAIHKVLEKDTTLFADLVAMIYKRDDGQPNLKNPTGSEQFAKNAMTVLQSWHNLPGTKANGTIDDKLLSNWIKDARIKCASSGHIKGGDLQIASILARSPSDQDGIWPHLAVRNVIEELNNKIVNDHIPSAIYNGRGVVTKNPNEGGNQERKLSQNYKEMSEKLSIKWPVTASILRDISDSYERDAKREDIDSDLHEIRWG